MRKFVDISITFLKLSGIRIIPDIRILVVIIESLHSYLNLCSSGCKLFLIFFLVVLVINNNTFFAHNFHEVVTRILMIRALKVFSVDLNPAKVVNSLNCISEVNDFSLSHEHESIKLEEHFRCWLMNSANDGLVLALQLLQDIH